MFKQLLAGYDEVMLPGIVESILELFDCIIIIFLFIII